MKLSLRLMSSTSMKFVTPSQYTKSNMAHFKINTQAASDFTQVYGKLGSNDSVLDFGCGTGETTLAIASGQLGNFGKPEKVLGVDISSDMVSHCNSNHSFPNLSFQILDTSQGNSFIEAKKSSFSLVSSFSCLHWVPDMPATITLFNKVLKEHGKFLFVIAGSHNIETNPQRRVYEDMKREPKWEHLLKNTSWMHYKTVHQNNSWMSTIEKHGYGGIIENDFVKLMENHGFKVANAKTIPLKYKFEVDFIKNYFKTVVLTSFPELQGETRKEFFNEYIPRVKEMTKTDEDGLYDSNVDGIQIFGEKFKDI